MTDPLGLNQDFLDIIAELGDAHATYVIVGGHALAVHGVPRATGDIDIFIRPEPGNAERVLDALRAFGAPVDAHRLTAHDLTRPGTVYQIGLPPRRIDVLTAIDGCDFDDVWRGRREVDVAGQRLPFIGRRELLINKRASGRPKDLLDLALLAETDD
ncbi:MAG: hypothetical protein R3F65_33510 [bacterium]